MREPLFSQNGIFVRIDFVLHDLLFSHRFWWICGCVEICRLLIFICVSEELAPSIFRVLHGNYVDFFSFFSCERGDFLKLFLHLDRPEVNEYSPWSGLLCGGFTDIPHVLYSSGPGLVLEFHTDRRASNASGFLGHFRFIDRRKYKAFSGLKCNL